MRPRVLLDTHILVRWLADDRRLTKDQVRALSQTEQKGEAMGVSAATLIELALLSRPGSERLTIPVEQVFSALESSFLIFPITLEIAREISALYPRFHDPADAAIVATARVHGLRLVTSDQRIIASNVVSTVE